MNEKDLENINQIDMECTCCDDDESFCEINNNDQADDCTDRSYQRTTNIILNFNDDDDESTSKTRTICADINNDKITINKNFNSAFDDAEDINSIDMETDYFDDDDPDFYSAVRKTNTVKSMFDDDDEDYFEDKQLIDDSLIESKKASTGDVEADYWKKLAKKHADSNKKGAYNTHFHFAGNPKLEMELFNHDMQPNTEVKTIGLGDIGMDLSGNLTGSEGGEISGNITGIAAGGEASGSVGESLTEELCELTPIFNILGFTINKQDNNTFKAIDDCNIEADIEADNMKDLISKLSPYIDDCFIYPLQIQTGEKFKTCNDWANWYTCDKEKEFPKCKNDINCCKILATYLK